MPFSATASQLHAVALRISGLTFTGAVIQAYVSATSVIVEQVTSGNNPLGIPMDTQASIIASGVYQTS